MADFCALQLFGIVYELISAEDWSCLILQSEIDGLLSLNAFLPWHFEFVGEPILSIPLVILMYDNYNRKKSYNRKVGIWKKQLNVWLFSAIGVYLFQAKNILVNFVESTFIKNSVMCFEGGGDKHHLHYCCEQNKTLKLFNL